MSGSPLAQTLTVKTEGICQCKAQTQAQHCHTQKSLSLKQERLSRGSGLSTAPWQRVAFPAVAGQGKPLLEWKGEAPPAGCLRVGPFVPVAKKGKWLLLQLLEQSSCDLGDQAGHVRRKGLLPAALSAREPHRVHCRRGEGQEGQELA